MSSSFPLRPHASSSFPNATSSRTHRRRGKASPHEQLAAKLSNNERIAAAAPSLSPSLFNPPLSTVSAVTIQGPYFLPPFFPSAHAPPPPPNALVPLMSFGRGLLLLRWLIRLDSILLRRFTVLYVQLCKAAGAAAAAAAGAAAAAAEQWSCNRFSLPHRDQQRPSAAFLLVLMPNDANDDDDRLPRSPLPFLLCRASSPTLPTAAAYNRGRQTHSHTHREREGKLKHNLLLSPSSFNSHELVSDMSCFSPPSISPMQSLGNRLYTRQFPLLPFVYFSSSPPSLPLPPPLSTFTLRFLLFPSAFFAISFLLLFS